MDSPWGLGLGPSTFRIRVGTVEKDRPFKSYDRLLWPMTIHFGSKDRSISSWTVHFGSNDHSVWLKTVQFGSRPPSFARPSTFTLLDRLLWIRLISTRDHRTVWLKGYSYARLLTGWMQDFVSKNGDLDKVFDRKVSYLPNEMFYRTMVNCDEHQLK